MLLFLAARGSGYAREIAVCWSMDVSTVQNQLLRMERDGLLISRKVGRTRVFEFNSRYAFKDEVGSLLAKALSSLPGTTLDKLTLGRNRPRRTGKPV